MTHEEIQALIAYVKNKETCPNAESAEKYARSLNIPQEERHDVELVVKEAIDELNAQVVDLVRAGNHSVADVTRLTQYRLAAVRHYLRRG